MSHMIIGHRLCPYVQRVVIVMLETGISFDRTDIDLDNKPGWLGDISPGWQVPVLEAEPGKWLFESTVIVRYLDQLSGGVLLPTDPLARAQQEAWMAFADGMLSLVARIIYCDQTASAAFASMSELAERLDLITRRFCPDDYFNGGTFGLADIVFATLFRYFPVLDQVCARKVGPTLSEDLRTWWARVQNRPSVMGAVPYTYEAELSQFIATKQSHAGCVLGQLN